MKFLSVPAYFSVCTVSSLDVQACFGLSTCFQTGRIDTSYQVSVNAVLIKDPSEFIIL